MPSSSSTSAEGAQSTAGSEGVGRTDVGVIAGSAGGGVGLIALAAIVWLAMRKKQPPQVIAYPKEFMELSDDTMIAEVPGNTTFIHVTEVHGDHAHIYEMDGGLPELCLSRGEWARRFAAFIREATPENLLGSSIYFDLRVVWGDERGCEQLRQGILDQVADNRLFQRMLAENALRQRPPVGRFREFVLSRKGSEKATLDLKVQGLTPFVDGARLLALANGIHANNTLERLRQLVIKEVIEPLDGAAYEEAYHFIQQTRMQQHQLQIRENQPYSNRVDPDSLNHLDRRILRESLRQALLLRGVEPWFFRAPPAE